VNKKDPSNDDHSIEVQAIYANLYNEIVKPDQVFVQTQYFRTQWVPRLNPSLAWLIVALRQHCYWNKKTGEQRDWCIIDQDELGAEIGVSGRSVRRLLKMEYADQFVVEVKKRYRYDQAAGKRVRTKTRYRVRMDDPLTPEDQARLKERLAEELAGLSADPETGQLDMLNLLDRPLSDEPGDLSDKESGRSTYRTKSPQYHIPDKESGRSGHLPDKESAILYTGQRVRNKDSTIKVPNNNSLVQQEQNSANVVVRLLSDFGIVEPALSRYKNHPLDQVQGWIDYATREDLSPGYVVNRLKANETPPPRPAPTPPPDPPPDDDLAQEAALQDAGLSRDDLAVWQMILQQVQLQTGKATFERWLKETRPLRRQGATLVIDVRTDSALEWITNRLLETISRVAAKNGVTDLRFEVGGNDG